MNKGFSLVELIVVIAIMAILVGVAVPVYTSYIDKAEDAKVTQYKEELERAINTVYIEAISGMTAGLETPTTIEVADGAFTVTDAESATCTNFIAAVGKIITVDTTVDVEFTLANGTWSIKD